MPPPPPASAVSVEGLVVVIVGGTTGLGLSAATALVAGGARVVIVGRSPSSLDAACEALGSESARGLCGDATDSATSEAAVELAVDAFGRLDGLYHVAGGSGRRFGDGPLHEMTDEGWRATLDLNLASLAWSNRAAIRRFLEQGGPGSIVNMGSVLGFSPSPEFFTTHAYAAAKSGVIGFSKSIAARYARDDIRVNVVAPALVETPMSSRAGEDERIQAFIRSKQPLDGGRMGRPNDLDGAVLFLLSCAARFVTGQVLAIDGGWSVTEGQVPPAGLASSSSTP